MKRIGKHNYWLEAHNGKDLRVFRINKVRPVTDFTRYLRDWRRDNPRLKVTRVYIVGENGGMTLVWRTLPMLALISGLAAMLSLVSF